MDKFTAVNQHFQNACLASKRHSEIASNALNAYGDQGPQISGIVREHFPENVKTELRSLASTVTAEMDRAYANRPKYVRIDTMRKLSRKAAQKHGHGFYGPQP